MALHQAASPTSPPSPPVPSPLSLLHVKTWRGSKISLGLPNPCASFIARREALGRCNHQLRLHLGRHVYTLAQEPLGALTPDCVYTFDRRPTAQLLPACDAEQDNALKKREIVNTNEYTMNSDSE